MANGIPPNSRISRRHMMAIPAAFSVAAISIGNSVHATPIEPRGTEEPSTESGGYFAQTGHNLRSPFYDLWKSAGGESVLGMPLSVERFDADLGVVQTFEGMTLVYDPSLDPPWDVQGQHLPADNVKSVAPPTARQKLVGCPQSSSSCQHFAKQGHTVSGAFATFWNANGDLPVFGMPLSEEFVDPQSGLTVQVFERAILEIHGGDVRVRAMGRQLADESGLLIDQAFLPAPPTGGSTKLVKSADGLRLRSGPSAGDEIIVLLPDNAEFISAPGASGDWIPGYADGYAGWVAAEFLKVPPKLPALAISNWNPDILQGAALGETNVRSQPSTKAAVVQTLEYGAKFTVSAWVKGEKVFTGADEWAQIDKGKFVYARNVGRNGPVTAPPLPEDAPTEGKWIDVHLTQQLMTAYEDRNPVRVCVTTTGMAGWETPTGMFAINTRVANETMESGAIGAESFYKLDDVLFTQYFTDVGHAIHFAWWRTPETIGRPGSHGCLNLLLDDSRYFWDWADIGTPLLIRHV